ncbi:MAG: hypothetical protein AAB521_00380 [Patescibacteria group bacterium]
MIIWRIKNTILSSLILILFFCAYLTLDVGHAEAYPGFYDTEVTFCETNTGTDWEVAYKWLYSDGSSGAYRRKITRPVFNNSACSGNDIGVAYQLNEYFTGPPQMLWWTQCIDPIVDPFINNSALGLLAWRDTVTYNPGNNLGTGVNYVPATDSTGNSCPSIPPPSTGSLWGYIFDDQNKDSVWQLGEPFMQNTENCPSGLHNIAGVQAIADPGNISIWANSCDPNNPYYQSGQLPVGTYTVRVDMPTMGGWGNTTPTSYSVNVTAGGNTKVSDFGLSPPPVTASITGRSYATTGQTVSFTGTANDPNFQSLSKGEMYSSPTSGESWTAFTGSPYTLFGSSQSFSASKAFSTPGTYWVVVNAHSNSGSKCTGNPFQIPSPWTDCGASSRMQVTVYDPKTSSCPVPSTLTGSGTNPLGAPYQYGDVDGDGKISTLDSYKILDYIGGGTLTTSQIERADVVDPGGSPSVQSAGSDVTAKDAQWILKFLENIITTFPACPTTPGTCTDPARTPVGFCVAGGQPLDCKIKDNPPVNDCVKCGCPSGQVCNTGTGACAIPAPTPTPAAGSCAVTTSPPVLNLTVGGAAGTVTASVTSGLGSATITRMRFGSYNTSIATVNPASDTTSIYTTAVTAVASGATAVWGTADLSDGRTCESGATDTDVNVSGLTPTPTPPPLAIYGTVFVDYNGNGTKDTGEPFIPGSEVGSAIWLCTSTCQFPSSSSVIARTPPDANGNYSLSVSASTNYSIVYSNSLANYTFPLNWLALTNIQPSSPISYGWKTPATINITNASVRRDIGLRPTYNISGAIYLDSNGDGIKNGAEANYTGSTLSMSLNGAAFSDKTLTGGDFTYNYLLGNQSHTIEITAPAGYVYSYTGTDLNYVNPRTVAVTTADVYGVNFGIIPLYTLTISKPGPGTGTVVSSPPGISCGADCSESYGPGTSITLTATPDPGSLIESWSGGGCSGAGTTCTVILNAPTTVTVVFSPPYTISGQQVADANSNGQYDVGEPNLSGSYSVFYRNETVSISGVVNASVGGYYPGTGSISVPAGKYLLTYLGSPPSGYQVSFPPSLTHIVTVGPSCSPGATGTSAGASCHADGNITNLNFGFKTSSAWFQSGGTDIRFDSGLDNVIPSTAKVPPAAPGVCTAPFGDAFTSVNGAGGSPGIIFTGDSPAYFGPAGSASAPPANWKVGSAEYQDIYAPSKGIYTTSYAYVLGRVRQSGITPTNLSCTLLSCTLPALASGVYTAGSDVKIVNSSDYTLAASTKVIILIDGNLTIAAKIFVPKTSTLTFIVRGDIHIDKSIGTAWNSAATQVEGYYSADSDFIIDNNNDSCVTPDFRLNMAGTVIVNAGKTGGQFINNRTLCTNNAFCPVFTIKERPDFVLNAPESIKQIKTIYQEVAP